MFQLKYKDFIYSGISTSITHARLPDVSQDTYVTKSLRGKTRHINIFQILAVLFYFALVDEQGL